MDILDELSHYAHAMLLQSLQTLPDLEAYSEQGLIWIKPEGIRSLMTRVLEFADTGDGSWVVQLAVLVSGDATGDEGIMDIVAGVEQTIQAAITNALDKWMRCTFPPIYAAFVREDQPGVGVTQLVARADLQWRIFSGHPQVLGMPQDQAALQAALGEKKIFPDFVGDALAERLSGEPRQLHWLKLLIASSSDRQMIECPFDNHAWEGLAVLLAETLPLPALLGNFLSVTQMLVIRPD